MASIRAQAEELANRPYAEVVFRDETTDDEPIYMALNPELDGCMAQGETIQDAQNNLNEFRIDYIKHLLEHNLPVPDPAWMATTIEDDSIEIQRSEPNLLARMEIQLSSRKAESHFFRHS